MLTFFALCILLVAAIDSLWLLDYRIKNKDITEITLAATFAHIIALFLLGVYIIEALNR